ncbi:MAG: hypothetical protein NVS3B10_11970 [Polyangiales bacterium]
MNPMARRHRTWRATGVVCVVALGVGVPACSLLIDFGAYRGPSGVSAESGGPSEGGDADDNGSCDASEDHASDPNNCGGCGHVCLEGAGSCDAGRCPFTPIFDDDGGAVQELAFPARPDGGTYLYFTTDDAFVARRSTTTGTIEKSLTNGLPARAVAVNATGARGVAAIGGKTIEVFDSVNFPVQPLTPISTDRGGVGPVWLSNDEVFWGDDAGVWWSATTPDAVAGGGPDAGSAAPVAFAELSGTVVWVTAGGTVFSTEAAMPGKITRLVAGGTETFACMAVSRTYLYLCERTPLGGGLVVYAVANLAAPLRTIALTDPQAVATDGQFVYVVDFRTKAPNDSRLLRARADGTQAIVLADGLRSSRGLAVDDRFVYVGDGPRILRTSK